MSVEQIEVPESARELTGLERIDYADAFRAAPAPATGRPPLEAARAVLAGAPANVRRALLAGWSLLGLRLGEGNGVRVLGWGLRWADDEVAVLAAESPLGIEAELVFEQTPGALLCATFVQLESEEARAAWAGIEPVHPPMVQSLLERAVPPV
ncbi:MAG TPA: hypothetical protein VGI73_06820 [Solirubrobacterales bacterium]|jgi:hypothetical protein